MTLNLNLADDETLVFVEGDAAKPIVGSNVLLTGDSDSAAGATLTVSITANKAAGEDLLGIDWNAEGVVFEEGLIEGGAVYVDDLFVGYVGAEAGAPGEPIIVVFTDGPLDAISRVMRAITYVNINQDEPSPATRTLTFHIGWDGGDALSANVSIDVEPVLDINDPPAVDMDPATEGSNGTAAYLEQGIPVVLAPNATVSDSDTSKINGGSLTVSVTGATAFDQVAIQHQGFGAGQLGIEDSSIGPDGQPTGTISASGTIFATYHGGKDGVPLVVTFLPEASVADAPATSLETLYRAITFANTSELPPAQRTVTFTVDDGDGNANGGNPITTTSVTVDIGTVNDAPVVDLNGAAAGNSVTLAYTENQAAVRIAPAATVTDDNPAKFNGGSLTISIDNQVATDVLVIGPGGAEDVGIDWGIGGSAGDSGAITLGGVILATFKGGKNGQPLVVNFFPEGSVAGFTTLETVQAILRSISYSSTSENPSTDPRTISFTLKDGQGTANGGNDTTIATATLNTTAVPDAPKAIADTVSIVNGSTTQINVAQLLGNDTDAEGQLLTVTGVSNQVGGTVSYNAQTGIITFVHTAGSAASFRYTIQDSTGLTSFATVTLNRAPVATTDNLAALINAPVTYSMFNLLGNDTDAESNALTITGVLDAVNGSVVLNANGTVTFTPNADYTGPASFKYTISDGLGTTTGTVNVNVRASNAAPVAVNDTVSVNEDIVLTTTQATLVANDTDSDGGTKVIQSVGNATGGTVVLLSNGSVRFTPNANFNGEAGYDYVLSDSQGGTSTAHVKVNVNPVNDAPVANVNTLATLEDTPLVIPWATLLGNDTDVDGDTLTITAVSTPVNGTVSINNIDKTITFTPAPNYNTDGSNSFSFRYTISDGKGGTSATQVNVNVTPVNDAPTGKNIQVGVLESGSYIFADTDFSAGFADTKDLAAFNQGMNKFAGIVVTTLPGTGVLYYDADGAGGADPVAVTAGQFISKADLLAGKFSFVADQDEIVNPTFTYQVRDDGGTANGGTDTDTTPRTVELALTPLNDAPRVDLNGAGAGENATAAYSIGSSGVQIAPGATLIDDNPSFGGGSLLVYVTGLSFGDRLFVSEDVPGLMLLGSQIYFNDELIGRIDSEGGTSLSISFLTPATAQAVQAVLRAVSYDGSGVFDSEPRTIEFQLTDGGGIENGGVDTTTVSAIVSFNNPPVADTGFTFSGNEDVPVVLQTADLTANAFDPDGDGFTIVSVFATDGGTPVLSADGTTITYTPAANYNGAASFGYVLRDSKGGTTSVTVNGTLASVDDNPLARTDTLSAQQGVLTVFQASQLLLNDVDPDQAGPLHITAVTSGEGGTVVLNPDGSIGFTPDGSRLGLVSFTYTVVDSNGGSSTGTANVTVKKLLAASEDVAVTYTLEQLIGTTTDAEGNPLTILSVEPLTGGGVTLNGDGTVTFTSQQDFNGRANFNFVLLDTHGNQIAGGALIDVAATPDNPIVYGGSFFAPKDQSYTYTAAMLLGQAYDPDGTPLTISAVSGASHGSVVLNADGSVTFTPTASYEGSAGFSFTVTDGNGGSTTSAIGLTVLRSLSGTEDSETIFTTAQIVGTGTFTNFSLGFDFTGGTFFRSGNSVFFTPDENFNGLASVDYSVTIGGVRQSGRVLVNVASVNDAPFGQNASVTIAEDVAHVFSLADFPFTDIDGNGLGQVVISTLPSAGILWLDGDGEGGNDPIQVTANMAVSRADIVAGHLYYQPPANGSGVGIGSFTFQVRDDGGTANGGADLDTTPNSFTINVTARNDAPVGQNAGVTIDEDGSHVFGLADFPFADVESNTLTSVVIVTVPAVGTLWLDSDGEGGADPVAVTANMEISRADIVAGHLYYQPPANANGAGIGSFTFQVRDNGGNANGGADLDSTPNGFTIDVTSVNDAPALAASGAAITYVEQSGAVGVASGVQLTDDQLNLAGGSLTVALTAGAGNGDAIAVMTGGFITVVGNEIRYNNTAFATIGAQSALGMTVAFGANASIEAVQALIEAVRYSNASDNPGAATREISFTLVDGGGTANGGHDSATLVRTVTVTPVDDDVVASDNVATTNEDATVQIDLLANDLDPDGGTSPAQTIAKIAGVTAVVGTPITLQSGAIVTLNADGTITYDPNDRFNTLISENKAGWTHGVNTAKGDAFSYTLANGSTAVVTVTVKGVDSPDDASMGTVDNDVLVGFPTNDTFMMHLGGDDWVSGGVGDDIFYFGGAYTAADTIRGGLGNDMLILQGNYDLTFVAGSVVAVEMLMLASSNETYFGNSTAGPNSYSFVSEDGLVAAGYQFTVQGNHLQAGEVLKFDGSAETDGTFRLVGGAADDVLTGGGLADMLVGGLGADQMRGGGGSDLFTYRSVAESTAASTDSILDFAAGDHIDLRAIDARFDTPANDAFSFIGAAAFHHVAGELRVELSGGNWTVQADIDGDGNADFSLTVQTVGGHVLGASDFML